MGWSSRRVGSRCCRTAAPRRVAWRLGCRRGR